MVTPKIPHSVQATSCSVRIERESPREVIVGFQLSHGDLLSIAMTREALRRFVRESQRALEEAPLPARRA